MKLKGKAFGAMLLLAGIAASNAAMAACPAPIALPPSTAVNSVTFGDGISYSLPILGISVDSSPGQIDDCIVVMTGASGTGVTTNPAGMDGAYSSPQGTQTYFRTGDPVVSPDPDGAGQFTGDTANSWDIQLTALSNFLNGNDLVIFFNHNQENSGGAANQDIFIWAQIRLVDNENPLATQYFYITSVPNATGLSNFGQPGGDPFAYTGPQKLATSDYPSASTPDGTCPTIPTTPLNGGTFPSGDAGTGTGSGDACLFVRARGQICLNALGIPQACDGTEVSTVNDNLGANEVANAIIFPEIQAILDSVNFGGYDVLQVDLRIGCNPATVGPTGCPVGSIANNGYEQIFLAQAITQVPAPGTLALLALGLLGIGIGIRRKA
jgi:PEP-CTERM motif